MQLPPEENRLSALIAVLGLITLLVGLIVMVLMPDIRAAAIIILALGIGLLATAFIIDFRRVRKVVTGRRGRFGAGTTVMISVAVGIALLANAISIGNYHRFDATGVSQFTLTSQTKEILGQMEIPVKVLCFFTPNDQYGITTYESTLLEEYQNYTEQLSVEVIDPDDSPDQAREYNITQYQTVVFESSIGRRTVLPQEIIKTATDSQGNTQLAGIEAEHAFTSAILEVTGIKQKKVYFLTGHGESNIDGIYSYVRDNLRDNLFKVSTVDLAISHAMPEDCTVLVIASPQKELGDEEFDILSDYLAGGGWVMIMLNPNPPQTFRQLVAEWGLTVEDGTVVDPDSSLSEDASSPIIPRIRNFFGYTSFYFPGPTALIPQDEFTPSIISNATGDTPLQIIWTSENSFIQLYSLARTSPGSWLEKNFTLDKAPVFNEGSELKGPFELGFLIFVSPPVDDNGQPTVQVPPTRLIVFGDSDFASNQHFYEGDNGNLFLNSVDLLATGEELISIQRKVLPFRRMVIGPDEQSFIQISSIGLLPLLVLIGGGIIWWRRR